MVGANPSEAKKSGVIAATGLITGNLIGAGILGLPINTGLAGFFPSFLAMLAGGGMMYLTALILGEQANRRRNATFDYPSLYETYLGKAGKWVALLANLVILYGLLTAYFTGGAKIVASLAGLESSPTLVMVLFAVPLIVLTCVNLTFLEKLNALLVLLLIASFCLLVVLGAGEVKPARLTYQDWGFLPATLPIIVTSFHFHNIIPTLAADLGWNPAGFRRAVFWGMLLALAMNAAWVLVGIGVLPLTGDPSILATWETNLPATVPMGQVINSPLFTLAASFFALVAIGTSFLANGVGLQNFLRDLLANTFGLESQGLVRAATFLPPLVIALVYPDIFLAALDLVGGVGIVVLFGVLPTLIVLRDRYQRRGIRLACLAALAFALWVLVMEVLQECDLIALKPWVEYNSIQF